MITYKKDRLIIEIEGSPECIHHQLMTSLVDAMKLMAHADTSIIGHTPDCHFFLMEFLGNILPEETALNRIQREEDPVSVCK